VPFLIKLTDCLLGLTSAALFCVSPLVEDTSIRTEAWSEGIRAEFWWLITEVQAPDVELCICRGLCIAFLHQAALTLPPRTLWFSTCFFIYLIDSYWHCEGLLAHQDDICDIPEVMDCSACWFFNKFPLLASEACIGIEVVFQGSNCGILLETQVLYPQIQQVYLSTHCVPGTGNSNLKKTQSLPLRGSESF
jgi:hypothetical protein